MAMRNLVLQLGMVQAEVSMVKATEDRKRIELNRIHKACMGPTGTKPYCKVCNRDLDSKKDPVNDAIVSGYQFAKGQYVEVTDQELESVQVPTNGAIEVQEICSEAEFLAKPIILTGQVYYLEPPQKSKYPPTTFGLLRESLRGSVAMARTAMYSREYTVAITVGDQGFVMYLIRYQSEIRPEHHIALPPLDQKQLSLCKMVVDAMRVSKIRLDYPDNYTTGLQAVIDAKVAGQPIATPAPVAPAMPNTSIEAQLQATLDAIRAKANKPVEPAAKPAEPTKAEEPKRKGKKGRAA